MIAFVTEKMFYVLLSPISRPGYKTGAERQAETTTSEDLAPGEQEQTLQVVLEMRSNPFVSRWSQTAPRKTAKGNGKILRHHAVIHHI